MKPPIRSTANARVRRLRHFATGLALGLTALASSAQLDSPPLCASDRQRPSAELLERFINADCADCWQDGGPRPRSGTVVLDWIVPGSLGDDAPLSAAASRDAATRLAALGVRRPERNATVPHTVASPRVGRMRVAHGVALGGYVGASIEWRAPRRAGADGLRAGLALVETLPAGTEGSPVERNLVRNVLFPAWDGDSPLSNQDNLSWYESRPMNIPEGARAERLRVIGWVEDAQGRLLAVAQSRCARPRQRG